MENEINKSNLEVFNTICCSKCLHCDGSEENVKECREWLNFLSTGIDLSNSGTTVHSDENKATERLKTPLVFTIDFDNTCATETFPGVGEDVIGAVDCLREMQAYGHQLILWTCRNGSQLELAKHWFEMKGIKIARVNDFIYDDTNLALIKEYGCPRKVIGNYNIDDKNFGCPTTIQMDSNYRAYTVVDWKKIRKMLIKNNLL